MIRTLLICTIIFGTAHNTFSQNEWEGFILGIDINYHYLFGGAQVNNEETIGEGLKAAIGIAAGYRWHFPNDNVFGMEFQLNQPFGKLFNESNPAKAFVEYIIKPQSALQFHFGRAFGENNEHLALGYFAFNQTRFDITINMPNGDIIKQRDFENFGRTGLGYEYQYGSNLSTRLQVGTSMDALPGTHNGIDTKVTTFYMF